MCGIFSILNNQYDIKLLKQKFNNGVNRGPESSKIIVQEYYNYVIGFHRLAINGYSDIKSNQPLKLHNCTLICNGEIYNYKKLYKSIPSFKPETASDCEIILHMYNKYGIRQTLQCIDGVFAFVLLDNKKNTVYVARDTYGIRPLFMSNAGISPSNDNISFSSDIKCISKFLRR